MKLKIFFSLILISFVLLSFSCKETKENSAPDEIFWNPELVDSKPEILTPREDFIKGINQSLPANFITANFGPGNHQFTFEIMINKDGKFSSLRLKDHIGANAEIKQKSTSGFDKFVDYLKTVKYSSAEKDGKKVGSSTEIQLSIKFNNDGKLVQSWQLTSSYPNLSSISESSKEKSIEKDAFTFVEQMPEFVGGVNALMNFMQSNVKYPAEAKQNGVEGKVMVQFIVDEQGKVIEPKIIKGIGYGCDEEALRVINLLKEWKPGRHNGKAVKVKMVIPFVFKLGY
jgi:TonB family protein